MEKKVWLAFYSKLVEMGAIIVTLESSDNRSNISIATRMRDMFRCTANFNVQWFDAIGTRALLATVWRPWNVWTLLRKCLVILLIANMTQFSNVFSTQTTIIAVLSQKKPWCKAGAFRYYFFRRSHSPSLYPFLICGNIDLCLIRL